MTQELLLSISWIVSKLLEVMIHQSISCSVLISAKFVSGSPTIVRADRGTENTNIAIIQPVLRHYHIDSFAGEKSFMYGRSTSNQVSRKINSDMLFSFCV